MLTPISWLILLRMMFGKCGWYRNTCRLLWKPQKLAQVTLHWSSALFFYRIFLGVLFHPIITTNVYRYRAVNCNGDIMVVHLLQQGCYAFKFEMIIGIFEIKLFPPAAAMKPALRETHSQMCLTFVSIMDGLISERHVQLSSENILKYFEKHPPWSNPPLKHLASQAVPSPSCTWCSPQLGQPPLWTHIW